MVVIVLLIVMLLLLVWVSDEVKKILKDKTMGDFGKKIVMGFYVVFIIFWIIFLSIALHGAI